MAHDVTVTRIIDGPKDAVLHVYIKGDGASADLTDYVLVDPADYGMAGKHRFAVLETLCAGLSGFDLMLKFEYLASDTMIWVVPEASSGSEFDFREYGGLKDRSGPLDGTGKILLATKGLTDGEGSFTIRFRKQ